MDIEMIKTDDPNIVIERTTTENKINTEGLFEVKEGYKNIIINKNKEIEIIKNTKVPKIFEGIIEKEMNNILGEIKSYEDEVKRIESILALQK